jgi:hypothetical protein
MDLTRHAATIAVLCCGCAGWPTPARAQAGDATRASQQEIAAAMRAEQAFGYDLRATVNAARLQADVILRLARAAHARDPLGPPFVITSDTYQAAFVDVTGVAPDALPIFIRMASRYGEDLLIEHRRALVIDSVVDGPAPLMVVRVRGGWADAAQSRYSFEDSSSSPTMRVIHERDTRFTIADYGDMVTHEQVRGLRGRATSGVLGALMAALGDATVTRSRFAVADDGTQILRGTVTKWASFTRTLTILPDGRTEQGIPDGREDLARIEQRLRQRLTLRYATDAIAITAPPWEGPRRP